MKRVMLIGNREAMVSYDPEIRMFRGEFTEQHGGADFYAADMSKLREEGERSLAIFLEECERRGIPTTRSA